MMHPNDYLCKLYTLTFLLTHLSAGESVADYSAHSQPVAPPHTGAATTGMCGVSESVMCSTTSHRVYMRHV